MEDRDLAENKEPHKNMDTDPDTFRFVNHRYSGKVYIVLNRSDSWIAGVCSMLEMFQPTLGSSTN